MASEFSVRSDSVDVEQIMQQIRTRIREKRGVDYTEDEILELASIKLEKFLDPARLRSDLLQHYRARKPFPVPELPPFDLPPAANNYAFEADTPYESTRGLAGRALLAVRRLLNPLLKLFINPNPIVHVLNMQSTINTRTTERFDRLVAHLREQNVQWLDRERVRRDLDTLNYEIAHNLVLEVTRLSMEVKNMKMRVESISSRLEFAERRARALEAVVQYRPGTGPAAEVATTPALTGGTTGGAAPGPDAAAPVKGDAQRKRRRRRRSRGGNSQGQAGPAADAPATTTDGADLFSAADDEQGPADEARDAGGPEPSDSPDDSDTSS